MYKYPEAFCFQFFWADTQKWDSWVISSIAGGPAMLSFTVAAVFTVVSGSFCTCYSKRSSEPTCVLFALLQLHVAHPDNLAHEADAGPDEVCATEVLQGQRARKKEIELHHPVTFVSLPTRQQNTIQRVLSRAEIAEPLPPSPVPIQEWPWHQWKMTVFKKGRNLFDFPVPTSNREIWSFSI